jgi:hypothetical protein
MSDKPLLTGHPLRMTFGDSTGLFVGEHEMRIGYNAPREVAVVLSYKDGNWPLLYPEDENDNQILFTNWPEAETALKEIHRLFQQWADRNGDPFAEYFRQSASPVGGIHGR